MTSDNTEPPSQGLVAGKYELVRMIGRGGMGSVWEGRHVTLGTSCAIKFIEAEFADSPEARSRFDKEAKAAATIQSKHAIQIYDHGVTQDGKPYIVMELLQGEPLDKRIDRGPISLPETARILQQVCRALARAHERGIVHRDLKPENIFLVKGPDDDELVAKVLDFGIAKIQKTDAGMTSSTKTGAVLGTPFYMSPEQARGLRNVDHRADVWSLGVIAFRCVTGQLPFDGESVGDLLVKICTAPVPIPSQVAGALGIGLPPNFDAVFVRALERDPERRYGTVTDLANALCFAAGIAGGTPVSSGQNFGTPSAPMAGTAPVRALTPGYGPPPSPHGYPMQGMPSPNPYAVGPGTPPPGVMGAMGAMTNAPFTSERVAGVPARGRGGAVVAVLVTLLLAGAAAGGVYFFLLKKQMAHAEPATAGLVATAAPSVAASSTPPPAPSEPPPAATALAPAASTTPTTAAATLTASKPVTHPGTSAKPSSHPGTAPATHDPPPPAAPPPPAPAPTPTPKKPNKNDPGY